jgi:hypothetical protein
MGRWSACDDIHRPGAEEMIVPQSTGLHVGREREQAGTARHRSQPTADNLVGDVW